MRESPRGLLFADILDLIIERAGKIFYRRNVKITYDPYFHISMAYSGRLRNMHYASKQIAILKMQSLKNGGFLLLTEAKLNLYACIALTTMRCYNNQEMNAYYKAV